MPKTSCFAVLVLVALYGMYSGAMDLAHAMSDPATKGEKGGEASEPSLRHPTTPEKDVSKVHEVATFVVPDLNDALMKEFMRALSDVPGVVAAKADMNEGHLYVTFTPAASGADDIRTALATVRPETLLRDVCPATISDLPAGHDCKNCPIHESCPKRR